MSGNCRVGAGTIVTTVFVLAPCGWDQNDIQIVVSTGNSYMENPRLRGQPKGNRGIIVRSCTANQPMDCR